MGYFVSTALGNKHREEYKALQPFQSYFPGALQLPSYCNNQESKYSQSRCDWNCGTTMTMTTIGKRPNPSLSLDPKLGHKLLRVKILTVQPGASCPRTASSPEEPPTPDTRQCLHPIRGDLRQVTTLFKTRCFPTCLRTEIPVPPQESLRGKMKQKEHLMQFMPHFGHSRCVAPSSPAIPQHVAGRTARARHTGVKGKGGRVRPSPWRRSWDKFMFKKEKKNQHQLYFRNLPLR